MDDLADLLTDEVAVYPAAFPMGPGGGGPRADGAPATMMGSVQQLSPDRVEPAPAGGAVGSETTYDVFLPGSAGASADQLAAVKGIGAGSRIETTAANPYPPMAMRAVAPPVAVMGGAWYRARCVLVT